LSHISLAYMEDEAQNYKHFYHDRKQSWASPWSSGRFIFVNSGWDLKLM